MRVALKAGKEAENGCPETDDDNEDFGCNVEPLRRAADAKDSSVEVERAELHESRADDSQYVNGNLNLGRFRGEFQLLLGTEFAECVAKSFISMRYGSVSLQAERRTFSCAYR